MSSLALMRWLESAPERYDAGMRWITLGRAARVQAAVAEAATPTPGLAVLEIGCGTGALTERLLRRGARVTAVDQNPAMLEQARARLVDDDGKVTWIERTAAEIDALPEGGFDAVVASFALSEMSPSERRFVLEQAHRRLCPGGRLAIGDEVLPQGALQRVVLACLRLPQAAVAWLVAGSVSKPIPDLADALREAGLTIRGEERWLGGSLSVVVGERAA